MPNDFLEKTLEDIIFENHLEVTKRGFPDFYKNIKRQFVLPNGRIIDLFTYEVNGDVLYYKIIELKKDSITIESFMQIFEYSCLVSDLVSGNFSKIKSSLILVGNDIDDFGYLSLELGTTVDLYFYKYKYDGIYFKQLTPGSEDRNIDHSQTINFSNSLRLDISQK